MTAQSSEDQAAKAKAIADARAAASNGLTDDKVKQVVTAISSVSSDDDLWSLGDMLVTVCPKGMEGLRVIIDAARDNNVAGSLTANTLRAYRAAADWWPRDKRVAGLTFTAHREAMNIGQKGDTLATKQSAAHKLLSDMKARANGARVTSRDVRQAVIDANPTRAAEAAQRAAQRSPRTTTTTTVISPQSDTATPPDPFAAIVSDLQGGALRTIAAIGDARSASVLNKLLAGTNAILAHVQAAKAKQARAAKTAKAKAKGTAAPVAPVTVKQSTPATQSTDGPSVGDVRGL